MEDLEEKIPQRKNSQEKVITPERNPTNVSTLYALYP